MNIVPLVERTWKQSANPAVGGPHPYVPPDDYETELVQAEPERVFRIAGPPYTDALFSTYTPIKPNTGHLALQFEYNLTQDALDYGQALEMDSRMQISKLGHNWSEQLNIQKGWLWQAYKKDPVTGKGSWRDTTFKVGPLSAGKDIWHKFHLDYSFDLAAHTYSFEKVQVDDKVFNFPAEFKNLPATPLLWADGVNCQIQLDLNAKGGFYETRMRRGVYIWS